jgi:hypothetical protein
VTREFHFDFSFCCPNQLWAKSQELFCSKMPPFYRHVGGEGASLLSQIVGQSDDFVNQLFTVTGLQPARRGGSGTVWRFLSKPEA